jgi:hypothetical protein
MSRVGFETTVPVSERAKTVHALDHSATVTGLSSIICNIYKLYVFDKYALYVLALQSHRQKVYVVERRLLTIR